MSIKIETGTIKTDPYAGQTYVDGPHGQDDGRGHNVTVCFIGGTAYLPDNDAAKRYAAYAQRQGWTVTTDAITPDGWDDLVATYRARDLDELARHVATVLQG